MDLLSEHVCFDFSLASLFGHGVHLRWEAKGWGLCRRGSKTLGSALYFSRVFSMIFFFVKSQVHRFSFVKGLLFSCFVQMFCHVHLQCVFVLLIHSFEQAYRPISLGSRFPREMGLYACLSIVLKCILTVSSLLLFLFFTLATKCLTVQ